MFFRLVDLKNIRPNTPGSVSFDARGRGCARSAGPTSSPALLRPVDLESRRQL